MYLKQSIYVYTNYGYAYIVSVPPGASALFSCLHTVLAVFRQYPIVAF